MYACKDDLKVLRAVLGRLAAGFIVDLLDRYLFGRPPPRGMAPPRISDPEFIRSEVMRLNLRRRDGFDSQTPAEWAAVYNGWGPDAWPDALRSVMTWVAGSLEVLAGPHDDRFAHGDGTHAGWRVSMDEWIANTRLVIADRYPASAWRLWPRRAIVTVKAAAASAVLEKYSYAAWVDASAREKGDPRK